MNFECLLCWAQEVFAETMAKSMEFNRPNWLRFVLPISSHVTVLFGSFSIMLLFAFMAQLFMERNMLEESNRFYQETDHVT